MHITPTLIQELEKVLVIDGLSSDEKDTLYAHVGHEVLENTLLRYLASLTEWEQSSFEQWIAAHATEANLMSELLVLYPDFGKIFSEEIIMLGKQLK